MSNELSQHGIGIIGLQGIHDSNVNITQILGKSAEYKDLLNQLETQQDLFAYVPEAQTEKRLKISQSIAQLEAQIEQFKQDVTKLAQEFNRIEINTDRLRRAKAHFEQGEIAAARAVFDSEREQMQDEYDRLVREKERFEQNVLPKLKHSSDEFYLRALLERTAYDNPNWLVDTCEYFERSINAQATEENVFWYAIFWQQHNRFAEAEFWYQEYLDKFATGDESRRAVTLNNLTNLYRAKNELGKAEAACVEALAINRKLAADDPAGWLPDLAMTLNNLGLLRKDKNELANAEAVYVEALEIYRKLVADDHTDYVLNVAMVLNNLGLLHKEKNELAKAEGAYLEALKIRRELAARNPSEHLPDVAMTLNNLGIVHRTKGRLAKAEAAHIEALKIRRDLAAVDRLAWLPDVAMTLNNLANLYKDKNELAKAEAGYHEALELYLELAADNQAAWLPNVAMTAINLAIYYIESVPNRELSIQYALSAIQILLPLLADLPYTQSYFLTARSVLQDGWGLSDEEIDHLLAGTNTES